MHVAARRRQALRGKAAQAHEAICCQGRMVLRRSLGGIRRLLGARELAEQRRAGMNEGLMVSEYVRYCGALLALRKSGDWKAWHETWDEYVKSRWGLSKSRAKLLCAFARFYDMCEAELFGTLPESPEQVKAILALPQKKWLEAWEFVLNDNTLPILPQNVESTLARFGIFANKKIP